MRWCVGEALFGEGFSEPLALGLQENEVMVEVLGVSLDVAAHGDDAGTVVGALACECVVGQEPEHARPLPAADVEERESVFHGLLVVMEPIDVGCFVGVEKGGLSSVSIRFMRSMAMASLSARWMTSS